MGFMTVDHVLEHIELKPGPKFVLIALAKHVKDDQQFQNLECWPSNRLIAKLTGMSERNVKRVIKELIVAGYVSIKIAGGGSKKSNRYKLNLTRSQAEVSATETVTPCPPLENQNEAVFGTANGDNLSSNSDKLSKRVTICPKKGDTMSPESIKESIRESINEVEEHRRRKNLVLLNNSSQKEATKKQPPAMWNRLKDSSW